MLSLFGTLAQPLLFTLEPEKAHKMSIKALKALPSALSSSPDKYPELAKTVAGLNFANPLGMSAGFDKNGEVPDPLFRLGFGFAEIGTITPLAQDGNPRPRVFRLYQERSLINRLGFNNIGHQGAVENLKQRKPVQGGILGINIGANKDSVDRIHDYELGIEAFYPYADYFTANISSPNTPGLRGLQHGDALKELLERVVRSRKTMAEKFLHLPHRPLFLKLAPDLDDEGLSDALSIVNRSGFEGVIFSNTTLSREGAENNPLSKEAGGLSGALLYQKSTDMLRDVKKSLAPEKALIGVGGVHNVETAQGKLDAGADLIQLYTGLIFEGLGLVDRILKGLT